MVPQYEYILLHGTATYVASKTVVHGPAVLRSNETVSADVPTEENYLIAPTVCKVTTGVAAPSSGAEGPLGFQRRSITEGS